MTPHIWVPKPEIILPPTVPPKPLFPGRKVEPYACMPTGLMTQRQPLKPTGFDFSSIAGLIMDLRSHAGTNQSSGGSAATATNDPVGEWVDQSGNGNSPTESTNKPTLQLSQVNGYPSVRFDGTNDVLTKTFTLDAPFNYFLVMKQISWTSNDDIICGGSGDNFSFFQRTSSPTMGIWKGDSSGFNNSDLSIGTWGIVQVRMGTGAGNEVGIKVNAGTMSSSGTNAPSLARGGVTIAAHPGPNSFANVEFARILLYNTNVSDANATLIRNALNAIYAIF